MSAKLARECFRGTTPEAEAVPLNRGVINSSLLCGCTLCGVEWDAPLPRFREGESVRVVSPGFLCDCAVCGFSLRAGASLRRPVDEEEDCLRRRSVRWKLKAPAMGSHRVWDAFGSAMHSGAHDPGGCGIQRVIGSVFSRDRVYDEEERHRCILHFPSMREFFTHEEVEHALVQLGWRSLTKRGGWRRYFKIEEPTLPYGLPTIAKLPGRSFVDSPKPIILDFVKTVNRRENRNIFCCWEHRGELLVSAGDRTILN